MPTLLYKDHLIVVRAKMNEEGSGWVPVIDISWSAGSKKTYRALELLSYATSPEEAESYGLDLAKMWIDRNPH
jgi:hypothetical protein